MVESSKILTVSYGTFSCTLEGFDDSFSTMKAIAEYFRDLAAGDRYFGAEPPTPDAEMLTRIAEREISRRVEARTSDAGIVLRASDPTSRALAADPAPAMPPAQTPPADAAVVRPEQAPAKEPETADVNAFVADASSTGERATASETVADKLKRIRSVVGNAADSSYAEDLDDDAPMPNLSDAAAPQDDDAQGEGDLEPADDDRADIEPVVTDRKADDMARTAAAPSDDVESPDEDQQVAPAKVSAIDPEEIDDVDAGLPDAYAALDDDLDDDTDDQIKAVLRNLERAGLRAPVQQTSDMAEDTAAPDPEVVEKADAAANMADEAGPDDADGATDTAQDDNDDNQATLIQSLMAENGPSESKDDESTSPAAAQDTSETSPDDDDPAPAVTPRRGRILRVTRRTRPDAVPAEATETVADPQPAAEAAQARLDTARSTDTGDTDTRSAIQSTLSAEAEADLQRDLAAAEQAAQNELQGEQAVDDSDDAAMQYDDLVPDASEQDDVKPSKAVAKAPAETTAPRAPLPNASEAEMSRITAQTEHEMANPESSRRREAIAHLKAAVAATEAARQLGEPRKAKPLEEGAFRDDLQQVVQPRRPVADAASSRTERPRPAPLKLVASQRVDDTPAAPSAPVQPRRVAKVEAAPASDNFAEYAETVGASSLQDLLEAAAAYIAIVEGSEDFSRPQIMKKVQSTTTEEFSREDGLRSFGTLLRQGRIEKARAGRFQISERTRFRPEPHAANG
ncbi:hypothetical protein [Loktanella sp. SALINAS62]|uniref:hypothetical protein n=1 Tax=Loktanella sp. SALINAS62 TaxID=2706124 RepID=UPI001B8CB5CD|nr:hypothetical protein [Loktanella sp. SALINAS62]MBS1303917.1 hypothetical protein [Loktanella sp. SALINAS62]